jgi:sec-independent protein translocase protein TatB
MLLLSPEKLLVILVIALIVLGPDKLPSVARRVGALWSEFNRWRAHLETEVRGAFPDLPSTTEIARAVRSPIALLDRLADEHGATSLAESVQTPTDAAPVDVASETAVVGLSPAVELSADVVTVADIVPVTNVGPVAVAPHPASRVEAAAEPDVSLMN